MKKKRKKRLIRFKQLMRNALSISYFRVFITILTDLVCVGIVLVFFALFHHVIPKPGEPLHSTMSEPTFEPTIEPTLSPSQQPLDVLSVTPTPPSPTPTIEIGDFSASFNVATHNTDATYHYIDNNLKISINRLRPTNTTYYIADVWIRNIKCFNTFFAKGQFGMGIADLPLKIAKEANAIFAVTGDYCGARSLGLVIRNGLLYRDSINSDVCLLLSNGELVTYNQSQFNSSMLENRSIWQAWGFGPELLVNGKAIDRFDESIRGANPRSSIGYYEPGHYCFIVADGRNTGNSAGLTLSELSQLYERLGCKTAFNLDGGQTAEMIFNGEVINMPAGGGRRSSDIIGFVKE